MASLVQTAAYMYSYPPHARRPAMYVERERNLSVNEFSEYGDSDSEPEAAGSVAETQSHETEGPTGGEPAQFSKELMVFYLFGRILPRHDQLRSDALKRRLAEVQQVYHNTPPILHFTYSTIALDQIGVAASQSLPKDTVLGPYSGRYLTEGHLSKDTHNPWLWEVFDESGVSSYIDGSDPKYGNWMSLIQCARSREEQNLKLRQQVTHKGVQLYFVVTRDIDHGQELLVWYDTEQVNLYYGLPLSLKSMEGAEDDREKINTTASVKTALPAQENTEKEESSTQQPTTASSTCTEDSGVYTIDQEPDLAGPHTKLSRESSPEEELERPQPPSLKPLTRAIVEDVSTLQEPIGVPIKPTQHLTTYTFIQSNHLTPQYGYIGTRDNSYSPQPSPRRLATQTWLGKRRSRSRSPVHTPTDTTGESGDAWRASGSPKSQLLYGMFMRSEDGSRWRCARCDRQFNSQGSLRAHARIHTGERPYKCKFCSRTFCQASTLRSHERLHTGEKPYKCGVCGRAFTQSAGLRSHLKTHMGGTRFD